MNFLSPWFLLGAALIAGPIIAHLIRQVTRKRITFSATRFLDASPPQMDRRNRVEHPWLLLLRCLIVAALAFAFARPYLKRDLPAIITPQPPLSVSAVLDQSASMQRAGLWDAARQKIEEAAADLGPNDQFALFGVSGDVKVLLSHEQWLATPAANRTTFLRSILADQKPGWGSKNLDSAIEAAASEWEGMADAANTVTRKKIVVVSDFTLGARVAGLAGLNWPKGCEVNLQTVTPDHAGNAGLQWLSWTDTDNGPALRVLLSQSAKSTSPSLSVQLRDARTNAPIGNPQKLTVEPKDKQIAILPVPADAADKPLRVDLIGDQDNYDNTVWAVRPTPRAMALVYYGGHAANDLKHARFYLERAIAGWKDPVVHLATDADPAAKPGAELFVVAGPLDAATTAALRKKLTVGDFAIVLLNDPAMVSTAAAVAGETGWAPITPAQKNPLFGQVDFQHPLFSLFADPHFSDFTHIQFWQAQSLKLPDKTAAVVAAKFDDGSPAVLEAPVGQGRVVVWGGDWSTPAGSWVLSTKFVPWLQSLFEREAGGALRPSVAEVGDLARLLGGEPAQWRALDAPEGAFVETTPARPGIYQVRQGGVTRWVALETPASASNLEPLTTESWEKLGVPLHAAPLTSASPITAPVGENQTAPTIEARQKLWRWLLLAAVFFLALESIYSLALSRQREQTPPEAST